ncbi:hypothetical protein JCM19000A_41600 [Silvimonas sp. JCM 19000]
MSTSNLAQALQSAIGGQSKRKQLQLVTEEMYRRYAVLRENRPLAIGTGDVLAAALPHFDATVISRALSNHCARISYQKQLAKGGRRFNLNGKPEGEVDEGAKTHAQALVDAAQEKAKATAAAAKGASAPAKADVESASAADGTADQA